MISTHLMSLACPSDGACQGKAALHGIRDTLICVP